MPFEPQLTTHVIEDPLPEALRSGITAGDISFSAGLQSYTLALENAGYLKSQQDLLPPPAAQPPVRAQHADEATQRMLQEVGLLKPAEKRVLRPEVLQLIPSLLSRDVSYSTGISKGLLRAFRLQSAPSSRKSSAFDIKDLGVNSAITEVTGSTQTSKSSPSLKSPVTVPGDRVINQKTQDAFRQRASNTLPLPLLIGSRVAHRTAPSSCVPAPAAGVASTFLPRMQPVRLPELPRPAQHSPECLRPNSASGLFAPTSQFVRGSSFQYSEASDDEPAIVASVQSPKIIQA